MSSQAHPTRLRRRGVTIIELLIVLLILLMVTAAAIPIMAPATQSRRTREAARLISSYISGARSRAIETGRPVGVMIERFEGQNFAMNLSYVEVPQPYSGDTTDSRVKVDPTGKITGFVSSDVLWQNVVRCGDLIRFNYRGAVYQVSLSTTYANANQGAGKILTMADDPATTNWYLYDSYGNAPTFPASYANGVPFQIIRQPIRSSAAAPLQLPEGAVIDLNVSSQGTSLNTLSYIDIAPPSPPPPVRYDPILFNPVITFRPSGSIDYVTNPTQYQPSPGPGNPWVTVAQGQARPISPIYLLLGRRELMPDVTKSQYDENLYDPNTNPQNLHLQNYWVAIGPQTGLVSVSENAPNTGPANDPTTARTFAQQAQSIGGQ